MTTPQILQAASAHVIEGKLAEAHDEFTWLYEHGMAEEAGEPGISQATLLPQVGQAGAPLPAGHGARAARAEATTHHMTQALNGIAPPSDD